MNQWEAHPKPIAPCTRDFSRAFSKLKVIARDSHSVVALYARVVIGRSNYFRVSTVIRKPLYESFMLQVGGSSPFKKFAFLFVRLVRSDPDPIIGSQKSHSLLLGKESFCLTDNWAERHWRIPGAINIQKASTLLLSFSLLLSFFSLLLSFSFFSLEICPTAPFHNMLDVVSKEAFLPKGRACHQFSRILTNFEQNWS